MRNKWMLGGSMVLLLLFAVGQVFAAEGQTPAAEAPKAAAPAAEAPKAAAPAAEAPKAAAIDDPAIAAQLQTAPAGLKKAIAEQIKAAPGTYNATGEAGYLGIPGGPKINMILAFCWALWVGWIFSTVGAFGGVMAGVGHMSVHGLGNYAKSFGKTPLNKAVTDSVRASNQMLAGLSAVISTFSYYRMKRLVLPLGFALGLGSILGAYLSTSLTAGKLNFSSYQGYFGMFVLALGLYLIWETSPAGQRSKAKAKEAAKAFEASAKCERTGGKSPAGVNLISFKITRCVFTFCGVEFSFNPLWPFFGGVVIASIAAFLGVGGGFLLVPFITSVTQLPMYLAAGTSALAVLVSMV
ncbi:MAG: sulfite exporter TauE/SafE family protein, partial [Desulfovibrio sp.]|nr:sulfite exporter TauE/SafE family protein [Desulfovibrio sp.]